MSPSSRPQRISRLLPALAALLLAACASAPRPATRDGDITPPLPALHEHRD